MKTQTKSANMHIRVNPETRERAMVVLNEMGISASELFNLLLNQVAIQHRIPFEIVDSKYSKISPSPEEDYRAFESWKEAKEWLNA
ncbi:MAG: type II toxin-antitoxin system RelB/DinJ family antitoxin [Defluviitaleaceae bacterium]|nr:type II toxin-antitoxin system RelB/DinJ family antitoxin [Defluviitaleaceae bacterium]